MQQEKRRCGTSWFGMMIALSIGAHPLAAQTNNGWTDYQTNSSNGLPNYPHFPEAGTGSMLGLRQGKPSPSIAETSEALQWEQERKQQKEQELREYAHCKAVYGHLFPRSVDDPLQISKPAPKQQTALATPNAVCPSAPAAPAQPPHVHRVRDPFLSVDRPGLQALHELCPGGYYEAAQLDVCTAYLSGVIEAMTAEIDHADLPPCLKALRSASENTIMVKFGAAMAEENRAPAIQPVYRGDQVRALIMRAFCSGR